MIIQAFLRWAETAKAGERARAANALARAYIAARLAAKERQAALMAMTYLLDDPSPQVRLALAEALSDSPETPRALILSLAEDQIEIACNVILRSPVLTDDDLVDLTGRGGSATRALIASRMTVSRAVSAALIEVGDAEEILILLENPGSCISPRSLLRLSERHGHDGDIRSLLLEHDTLPATARHILMQHVTDALSGFPLVRSLVGGARIERVARDAQEAATVTIAGSVRHDDIEALVEHLRNGGCLTPAFLIHALCCGNVDFIAGALVNLTGLDDGRVRSILAGGRMHAIRALFEAAGVRRDISPVFVEATRLLREAAHAGPQDRMETVCGRLLSSFDGASNDLPAISELMAMVQKLHIAEQRHSARSYAMEATLVAA